MMALAASVYRAEGSRESRVTTALGSTVRNERREPIDATILDVSTSGFRVRVGADLSVGDEITLGLAGLGMVPARVVRQSGQDYGCEFRTPVSSQALAAALTADTLLEGRFAPLPLPGDEPAIERWPAPVRLSIIIGSTVLLWAALIGGAYALIA